MTSSPSRFAREARQVLAAAVALAALSGANACASIAAQGPVALSTGGAVWSDAVADATRRFEAYDVVTRQADLRATLFTPRVRRALAQERARFHGHFAAELQQELLGMGSADEGVDAPARAQPLGEEQVLVFAALYVSDVKNRDLAMRDTIWDTQLVRGEHRVKALAIEPVRMSPTIAALFPYVDRFDDLYLLRFPAFDGGAPMMSPAGAPLRLEIRSALADVVVQWSTTP